MQNANDRDTEHATDRDTEHATDRDTEHATDRDTDHATDRDTDHATDRQATESAHSDAERHVVDLLEHPAMRASDTIHAAVVVLEGVQEMRYDDRHPHLRECMRQTALAALRDAQTDAQSAWSACHK